METPRGNALIAMGILFVIVCLGFALAFIAVPPDKLVRVTIPAPQAGCACAQTPVHVNKFLIFWKEKEKDGEKETQVFKAAPTLYDSITDATKMVPFNAAEVRIVTVRVD